MNDWLGGISRILGLSRIWNWVFKDRRKVLPYEEVVIGTFTPDNLSVEIRAHIFLNELNENIKPHIDTFLERISIDEPYCPNCLQPLDYI